MRRTDEWLIIINWLFLAETHYITNSDELAATIGANLGKEGWADKSFLNHAGMANREVAWLSKDSIPPLAVYTHEVTHLMQATVRDKRIDDCETEAYMMGVYGRAFDQMMTMKQNQDCLNHGGICVIRVPGSITDEWLTSLWNHIEWADQFSKWLKAKREKLGEGTDQ
jgi:hypothetical protein